MKLKRHSKLKFLLQFRQLRNLWKLFQASRQLDDFLPKPFERVHRDRKQICRHTFKRKFIGLIVLSAVIGAIMLLGDWLPRKNSRWHNSIYNIYWLLTRFKFDWLLTQLFSSNLEVHFTGALSWQARIVLQHNRKGLCIILTMHKSDLVYFGADSIKIIYKTT